MIDIRDEVQEYYDEFCRDHGVELIQPVSLIWWDKEWALVKNETRGWATWTVYWKNRSRSRLWAARSAAQWLPVPDEIKALIFFMGL